ncbi:MAG: GDSL-type esterase/lipase family protein [Verrucomicrobiota bacterium]
MKLNTLLATLLFAGSAFAQTTPAIWPMPSLLPVIPPGVNTATYPSPRAEWVQRVAGTNAKAHAIADSIQVVFDGDSITDGWQSGGKTVWAERYGKLNAFDFGISGDKTQHVLWRLAQGQVDEVKPKLIALMIGTNNLGSNTVEEIAGGIKTIVAEYQKRCPEATILLQAIFPRAEQPTDPARAKIKAINQIISKLGDDKKVIYVDFGDKFLQPDGTMSREIMPDFLHPSAKGYQIWADAIQPIIDRFFPAK